MKLFSLGFLALLIASCAAQPAADGAEEVPMSLSITSTAFGNGEPIPSDYSCDGRGVSPPLAWSGAPEGTKSFALITDDPDAPVGVFVHWVIYNLPASTTGLEEATPDYASLPGGSHQGPNSAGGRGYMGPCPPGGTHRYFFKLYALDSEIAGAGLNKAQLLQAMEGHILAQGELIGTYTRKSD